MTRRLLGVAAALLALGLAPAAVASAPNPATESGNPINDQGSNYNYRSNITSVAPSVPGLSLQVLEFADRMLLINHSGKTVTIYGYDGEPYARVLGNGTVEQNLRSTAVYLNTNFYADVTPPASASTNPATPPEWQVVDKTGQFEWHDHRIHWMSPQTPPQVKDKAKLTKIFDWAVPISVGSQKGVVDGELFWTPENSKAPVGAIIALVVLLLGSIGLVFTVRRRRRRTSAAGGAGTPTEVW
ncbi:MAG TPA: hypothetical protein VG165_06820 [Solirubrobacteraceae bacterium]|jgi:hypothetical protein|nr:hypothetical protein [Solirubrobacteraceae bacterium]